MARLGLQPHARGTRYLYISMSTTWLGTGQDTICNSTLVRGFWGTCRLAIECGYLDPCAAASEEHSPEGVVYWARWL